MYRKEKMEPLSQMLKRSLCLLFVLGGTVLALIACEKELELPAENPQQQENPDRQENPEEEEPKDSVPDTTNGLGPDALSAYLVLKDAVEVTGEPPTATDGQLKIDVKDTLYLIKGYPYGDRIRVKHDPAQHIAGFNIYVGGSSYYFDVPAESVDGGKENDTIVSLILDLDLPEDEMIDFPFSTEITIQPHDGSGNPLDEFPVTLTVEEPVDDRTGNGSICNSITQTFEGLETPPRWKWDFSHLEFNGEILIWAPDRKQKINPLGWGCCVNGNISGTAADSPFCREGTTQPGYVWVELEVDDYVIRNAEFMWVFDNDVFNVKGQEDKKQYFPSLTDFCTGEIGYEYSLEVYGAPNDTPVGTHDFTPGATRINLDLPNWQGSYRMPRSATLVYTCHSVLFLWDFEGLDFFYSRFEEYPTFGPEFHD